jgi:hypothetical protein
VNLAIEGGENVMSGERGTRRRDEAGRGDEAAGTPFPAGLSRPATSALHAAGYTHLDQLTAVTAAELLELHGMGPKGVRILREALSAHGASFAGEDEERR